MPAQSIEDKLRAIAKSAMNGHDIISRQEFRDLLLELAAALDSVKRGQDPSVIRSIANAEITKRLLQAANVPEVSLDEL